MRPLPLQLQLAAEAEVTPTCRAVRNGDAEEASEALLVAELAVLVDERVATKPRSEESLLLEREAGEDVVVVLVEGVGPDGDSSSSASLPSHRQATSAPSRSCRRPDRMLISP